MPLNVLDLSRYNPAVRLGEAVGGGLGSGIAKGVDLLAENKMKQIQMQHQMNLRRQERQEAINQGIGLLTQFGVDPKDAPYIASLPPKEQAIILQSLGIGGGTGEQGRGQSIGSQNANISGEQQNITDSLNGLPGDEFRRNDMENRLGGLAGTPKSLSNSPIPLNVKNSPISPKTGLERIKAVKAAATQQKEDERLSKEARAEKYLEIKQRGVETVESKAVRDWVDPKIERAKAAMNNIRDYDILQSLAEKGKLRAGRQHQFLSLFGIENYNQNTDTQIADKISARLGQNASAAFGKGTRITNFLEQTFQRSIPRLWNTPEGIIAISKINKLADETLLAENKAARDLIGKWGNRLPADAEYQLWDAVEGMRQRNAKRALDIAMTAEFPAANNFPKGEIRRSGNDFFENIDGEWKLLEEE